MLSRFIDQLSQELGWLEPVAKEKDDSYLLFFEPNVKILLKEENPETVRLHAALGFLPKEKEDECMLKMMSANLFGKYTGRNVFGLNLEGKEMVLTHFLLGDANYKQFRECLEDFVNYAEVLGDEIKH